MGWFTLCGIDLFFFIQNCWSSNVSSEVDPVVSVIVTTKNEERNIGACLESVVQQSMAPLEVIVVDNNSEDQTSEIAKQYGARVFQLGPERSAQRNYGVEKAHGV